MADLRETGFEFIQGDSTGTFYSAQKKWINKIHKYAEQYPDEVKIVHINPDGSVLAHIDIRYFKISPPRRISKEHLNKLLDSQNSNTQNK